MPKPTTHNDHVHRHLPGEIQPSGRRDTPQSQNPGRRVAVDRETENGINLSLFYQRSKERRVLNGTPHLVIVAITEVGIGQGRKRHTQQPTGNIVAEPVCAIRQTNLLPVNSEVADTDIRESHGPRHSLAVTVLDVHVGDRLSPTILELFDSRGSEAASILGNKPAGIVDALKAFGHGPCVGAASVEEELDLDTIPKGFGGVLCSISICCRNIAVANTSDTALMGAQEGGHRSFVGERTAPDWLKLLDVWL